MFFIPVIILILDQFTKHLALGSLKEGGSVNLLGEFLRLSYVENRGAAFGILQEQRMFFVAMTSLVIVGILYLLKSKKHEMSKLAAISLLSIAGGAAGNMVDRVRFGYVVDFIDVRFGDLYAFPVFNVADISIVIGTALLMVLIITGNTEKKGS